MSYKDALKKSQGGGASFVKLDIIKMYRLKDDEDTLRFTWYNPETKKDEFIDSLEGVLIGSAMKMSLYDQTYGANGGSYNSSHYFSKADNIVIWNPANSIEFRGTAEEGEKWLMDTARQNVKKRMCLFLATINGLIEVETNVTLHISQAKTILKENKDAFLDNIIKLSPAIYKKEHFGKDVHKIMKDSIVKKNPPKYGHIELDATITEEMAEELNVINLSETFTTWKEQIQHKNGNGKAAIKEEIAEEVIEDTPEFTSDGKPINKLPF